MPLTFELLRADDLLVLRVDTVNLKLDTSDNKNPKLVPEKASDPSYLVVEFQPQSIFEKAYLETENNRPGSDPLDPPGTVPARMSGGSRLVFQLPKNLKQIPFTMNALLDWSQLELVLSPTAQGKNLPPPIVAPKDTETALEIPYRVVLSPADPVGWLHARNAVTHSGRTELWHTRAGKFINVKTKTGTQKKLIETDEKNTIPLRAIWSPDFVDHAALPPDFGDFRANMTPKDRAEFVILTSGVQGYFVANVGGTVIPWVPIPIKASRLFLSALGGYLSSRGSWPSQPFFTPNDGGDNQQLDISEWDHIATQGRDHYVRIIKEGYLYPFGHRAAFITVTERKVVPSNGSTIPYPTAYLKQYLYVILREKEKTYPTSSYQFAGREMPLWQSIRFKTLVTPYLDDNTVAPSFVTGAPSFWINVGGSPFPFHVTGIDLSGKEINFLAPLIFMDEGETAPTTITSTYKGSGDLRLCPVSGQKLAYADPAAGDTTLKTDGLYFDSQLLQNAPPFPTVPFIPTLDVAAVTVPAVERILGTTTPVKVQLYSRYLSSGIDSHAAVFAQVSDSPPPLKFSADKAGGFSTPNIALTALSAKKGLVAGNADDAANGVIKPAAFFDISAKLFGTVPLQALIPVDGSGNAPADQNAPEIRTVLRPNSKNPDTLVVKLSWSPQLQSYDSDPIKVLINQNGTSSLSLKAELSRSLKGGPPTSDIQGNLTFFACSLLGVVGITFKSLKFSSKNGEKLNVKADLADKDAVGFMGPLEFIQKLADILPPGLFGAKGPTIQLQSDKIRVSYTLGLPSISVGVLSLEHISILAAVDLPYLEGKPAFEFGFASRSKPFLITVECLGGGGFVHLIVDADGVQMVEGALEFGGEFSFDIGVASGGVHIFAGIYFKLSGSDSDLTGFVDLGGEVSVLGIISISLDLNLSLSYEVQGGKKFVDGKATMTVAVHVLFFSASVSISVEKKFKADSGDPRIADVLKLKDWEDYCTAYA